MGFVCFLNDCQILERCLIHKEDEICDVLYPVLIFVMTGHQLSKIQGGSIVPDQCALGQSNQDRLKFLRQSTIEKFDETNDSNRNNGNLGQSAVLTLRKERAISNALLKDMKTLMYSGPKQDNVRKYWILEYFCCSLKRDKLLHCSKLSQTMVIVCKLIETVDHFKVTKLCFEYIGLALRHCYPAVDLHYVCLSAYVHASALRVPFDMRVSCEYRVKLF